jgi:hypothetical protein
MPGLPVFCILWHFQLRDCVTWCYIGQAKVHKEKFTCIVSLSVWKDCENPMQAKEPWLFYGEDAI